MSDLLFLPSLPPHPDRRKVSLALKVSSLADLFRPRYDPDSLTAKIHKPISPRRGRQPQTPRETLGGRIHLDIQFWITEPIPHLEKVRIARENAIRAFLTKNSNLTKIQLSAVLSYVQGEHVTSDSGARKLLGKRVTKGAFFRSLTQARHNIGCSIYTLTLLVYEGVISQRDIDNITIVGNLLRELAESQNLGEMADMQAVLEKSESIIAKAVKGMTAKRL